MSKNDLIVLLKKYDKYTTICDDIDTYLSYNPNLIVNGSSINNDSKICLHDKHSDNITCKQKQNRTRRAFWIFDVDLQRLIKIGEIYTKDKYDCKYHKMMDAAISLLIDLNIPMGNAIQM
mgnify:CR=1 FL=1